MDFTNKKTLLGDIYGAEISTQTISSMTYRVLHLHKEGRFGLVIPYPLVVETSKLPTNPVMELISVDAIASTRLVLIFSTIGRPSLKADRSAG